MASFRSLATQLKGKLAQGRRPQPGPTATYHSRFGGLWTDRLDALPEIDRRLDAGAIKDSDADLLRQWCEKGYVLLPQAVDPAVCDRVRADIERAWQEGDERIYIFPPGSQSPMPLSPDAPTERIRAVDIYAYFESAREALFSAPILRFLNIIFEDAPLLFQSLSFEQGSQQGMHQDTAYVVVDSPLELAASWIALEDITAGSGELMYYEGSHRIPEYLFSGTSKHFKPERDGSEQHEEWARLIHEHAQRMGLPRRTFLPRKGDVFIWDADLAHGGSPVENPTATRKSLVGHYCPNRCQPHYFSYQPERRTKAAWGEAYYSSSYYALAAG
jgi:phytanoyl-CoA hydroxylase